MMESFLRNSKSAGVSESLFQATLRGRFSSALLTAALIAGSQGCSGQHASPQQAVQKAVELQEAGQYDAAITALTTFLKTNPESAKAYYERGNCYIATADLPKAISDLEIASDLEPSWDRVWRALGNAERANKQHEASLQYLTNAIELNPDAADSRYDRGCLLQEIGQKQFALEDFRRAAELNPEDSQALLCCAVLESEVDQVIALDRFAQALRIDRHSSEAWLQRGLVYEKMGNHERALGDMTVACRLDTDNATALSHRSRLLSKLDQLRQAAEVVDSNAGQARNTLNVSSVSMPAVLDDVGEAEGPDTFLSFPVAEEGPVIVADTDPSIGGSEAKSPFDAFESFPVGDFAEPPQKTVAAIETSDEADGFRGFPLEGAADVENADAAANPFLLSIVAAISDSESPVATDAVAEEANLSDGGADVNPFTEALMDDSKAPADPVDVTSAELFALSEDSATGDETSVAGVVSAENIQLDGAAAAGNVDTAELYQRALTAYRDGDRTASVAAFELLLDADPHHLEGRFRYANVLAETGDPEDALIVCTPLVKAAPQNADYAYFRAKLLSQLKSYDESATEYTRLMSLGSRQGKGLTERAKVYLAAGRWEAATKDLTELIRRQPNDVMLLKQRAKAQERMQSWSLAIADWTQISLIEPNNVEVMEARADAFLQLGENTAAISDLRSLLRVQPENIRIATRLANLHATLEQWAEVTAILTPIVQRQQADTALTFLRAKALVEIDDETVALSDLNHVLSKEPNHLAALGLRARLLANVGDTRESLDDLKLAMELSPDDMSLLHLRSQVYAALGNHNAAVADLSKLITQVPDDTDALLRRAELLKLLGNDEGAMADADRILRLAPAHHRALVLRGDGFFKQRKFDQAATAYNSAIEQDGTDSQLLWQRCQCRLHVGQETLAVQDLNRIIKLNPNHYNALLVRARMQEKSGVYDGAVADLSRVLESRPDAVEAWTRRGKIHHRTGRFEESVHDLNRAILIQPDNADALYRRGLAYHQLRKSQNALKDLSAALKLEPSNADFIYSRGNVHAAMGQTTEAMADYRQAVQFHPDHSAAWYNQGNLLFAQEAFEGAIECWDKAIAIQPGLFRAYNNRAAASVQLKRYQQAINDYEATIRLNPEFSKAYDNYAFLLATAEDPQFHDPEAAVVHAKKACELSNNEDWTYLSTLAAAYAESGDYETARKWLGMSHKVAPEAEKPQLVQLARIYEAELERSRTSQHEPEQPRIRL